MTKTEYFRQVVNDGKKFPAQIKPTTILFLDATNTQILLDTFDNDLINYLCDQLGQLAPNPPSLRVYSNLPYTQASKDLIEDACATYYSRPAIYYKLPDCPYAPYEDW